MTEQPSASTPQQTAKVNAMAMVALGIAALWAVLILVAMSIGSPGPTNLQLLEGLLPSIATVALAMAAMGWVRQGLYALAVATALLALAVVPVTFFVLQSL